MSEPAAHLFDLELRLARRTMPFDEIELVIAGDFFEFGRSGRRWTRSEIVEMLARGDEQDLEIDGFEVHPQSPDIVLVTYRTRGEGGAWRSSLWARHHGRWQIVFHQGTPITP